MGSKEELRQVTLFRGLNDEELEHIWQIARSKFLKKKNVIFHEGSDKDAVYFIKSGLVKTFKTDIDGNEQIVSLLSKGDMLPHTGFFNQAPYPATAETLSDTHLVILPIRSFEQLIFDVPALSISLINMMGAKIGELQKILMHITGHDVQGRLSAFLLKLADQLGERTGDQIRIELPITNQEIANTIGTTRETVNRLLNQMKREKIVESNRSEIIIRNIDALKEWQG